MAELFKQSWSKRGLVYDLALAIVLVVAFLLLLQPQIPNMGLPWATYYGQF